MFTFLSAIFFLASTPTPLSSSPPQEILRSQTVRPLPGSLNEIPVFNSNSPELVLEPGILLSTFSPIGKTHSQAHLDFPFMGYFDIFAHHVAKAPTPEDLRTLYLGIIVYNPNNEPVKIDIFQAASYLSQPDAPFLSLDSFLENPEGEIYAGPGSRVMGEILRGWHQLQFPFVMTIPPGESQMLLNLPIPVKDFDPPINGRSSYLRLWSSDRVYLASLAMFAPQDETGRERLPMLSEWEALLQEGNLAKPRDRAPTPPDSQAGSFLYGRVAGVALGSQWETTLTDNSNVNFLTIPDRGQFISYGISTLDRGTLGTEQIQSAPLVARYPDTAYKAHGNYGVRYSLKLPLYNPTDGDRRVTIALETPIKQDELSQGLRFFEPLPRNVFFRGTIEVEYPDDEGILQTRYYHLVQRRGQRGESLVTVNLKPRERRSIHIELLYPPDSTPPQVITIHTLDTN
ncbi:MAG: DUF3370 domain-containing protein [Cyanobacteria bacterium SBLK]|nr:DUF3370 domain-containing protein [Cyanobacteria bacterium SBLK]